MITLGLIGLWLFLEFTFYLADSRNMPIHFPKFRTYAFSIILVGLLVESLYHSFKDFDVKKHFSYISCAEHEALVRVQGDRFTLKGRVTDEPWIYRRRKGAGKLRFNVDSKTGSKMRVSYVGNIPKAFDRNKNVVMTGSCIKDVFVASDVKVTF